MPSGPRIAVSDPSPILLVCSFDERLAKLAPGPSVSCSLGLLDRVGFVRVEFAGDADTGDGRGC